MRIGIDARRIAGKRGMDRYTRETVSALSRLDDENEYVLFGYSPACDLAEQCGGRFTFEDAHRRFRMIHNRVGRYIFRPRFRDIDVFHFPTNDVWYSKYCKTVVTLHDVIPGRYPKWHFVKPSEVAAYRKHLLRIGQNADCIVTDSKHQRWEIVDLMGVAKERVVPVYLAPASCFGDVAEESLRRPSAFSQSSRFLLFVGSYEERKNLKNVLRAFAEVVGVCRGVCLVVVACETNIADGCNAEKDAGDMGLRPEDVVFMKGLDDRELAWLYRNAEAFVFPSYDEGFGLPPLEAMACGTPVIASDIPVCREVLGTAALFVDPESPEELQGAMVSMLSRDHVRDHHVSLGRSRVQQFSWEKTARELREVYRKVAEV